MPIEIHELVIRAVVDPSGASSGASATASAGAGRLALDAPALDRLKREIAAACLEQLRDELAARTSR